MLGSAWYYDGIAVRCSFEKKGNHGLFVICIPTKKSSCHFLPHLSMRGQTDNTDICNLTDSHNLSRDDWYYMKKTSDLIDSI